MYVTITITGRELFLEAWYIVYTDTVTQLIYNDCYLLVYLKNVTLCLWCECELT